MTPRSQKSSRVLRLPHDRGPSPPGWFSRDSGHGSVSVKWTGVAGDWLSHRWAAQHVQKPFVPAPCQAPGATTQATGPMKLTLLACLSQPVALTQETQALWLQHEEVAGLASQRSQVRACLA